MLDVDYTLFDHRSTAENAAELGRPYLHEVIFMPFISKVAKRRRKKAHMPWSCLTCCLCFKLHFGSYPSFCIYFLPTTFVYQFLSAVYPFYDIIIWSATSMKWVALKMQELRVTSHTEFNIVALMDSRAMITVQVGVVVAAQC